MNIPAHADQALQELEGYVIDNAQAIVDAGEERTALQRNIQQLREEKQQLKATLDQLVTRLDQLTQALELVKTENIAENRRIAEQAQSTANTAVSNAKKAQTTADDGVSKAKAAQSTANTAISDAKKAQKTADDGVSKANNAQNTANDARNRAINAQNTANDARNRANKAQNTANTAVSKAGTAIDELTKKMSFKSWGKELEVNNADKEFHSNRNCPEGRVMATLEVNQAAICVCITAEKGKGWYCFN